MKSKLVIALNGAMLFVIDKTEQRKIYKWFALESEPVAFVMAVNAWNNGVEKEPQEYVINRNSIGFMTWEDN